MKFQIGTSSSHGGRRKLPYAFNEKGAVMAANILNSPDAVQMSIFVVRAFIEMRSLLDGTKELAKQLADLEKKLTARLDEHEVAIVEVLRRVVALIDPPPPPPEPPRRWIVFQVEHDDKPEGKARKGRNQFSLRHMLPAMDTFPAKGCDQGGDTGFTHLNALRL